MSFVKSSSRYSSKTKFSVEKTTSFAKGSQGNKNREEIIKNKVYCPVELKDVYKILEDGDKLLANKACDPNELIEYNEKLNEFINLCQNYKVTTTTTTVKTDLKKTFNPIEQNLNYLNKHIEAAKKDSIMLKKKIKKYTDPNYLSNIEEKNKQVCSNIEYVKKEIKTLKDNIRKNERLLDTGQKKPNEIVLQKEYKNLLTQQGNLYSRLVQLQSANKVYEENIAKMDAQYEEIKKKLDELNLKKENAKEKEECLFAGLSVETSKDNLEKQIFNLNAKRDNLKREKNNQVNNLTATLTKLKKQIANLENAKIALLNEEKSNIEKYEILKKSLNSKALRAKSEAKIKQKEQKYTYYETKEEPEIKEIEEDANNPNEVYSSYEEKTISPSHFKATNKQSSEDKHFFEDLLAENEEETINALKTNIQYELLKNADDTEDWIEQEPSTQFHQIEDKAIYNGKKENKKKNIIKNGKHEHEMVDPEQEQKSDMHQKINMSLDMGIDTGVEMGSDIDLGFEEDMLLKLQNQLNQKMQKEELPENDLEKGFDHYNDLSMEEFDKEDKQDKEEDREDEEEDREDEEEDREDKEEENELTEKQQEHVTLDGKGENGEESNEEIKQNQVNKLYAAKKEGEVYQGEVHTDLQKEKEKLMPEEMNISEKRIADDEQISLEEKNDVETVYIPGENNEHLETQDEEPISENEESNKKKEEAYKNCNDNNEHVQELDSEKNV